MMTHALTRIALAASLVTSVSGAAQKIGQPLTLTAQDRAEIQQLSASYARSLGTCAAEEYANLFESPNGFFESLNRGRVSGRASIIALVKSERQCTQPSADRSARPAPTAIIDVSPQGVVTGRVPLDSGHYEDVYVKTASGWRFRSRNNVPKKAEDAGLTYRDFAELRELAGDHGQFEDVYTKTADGLIYRSSGLTFDPVSREEVTGKVHLKNDDGRYDDVYMKTANGWRFKSRLYVPTDDAPARPTR
ncbi:MAG: nuclear transport factor 2 family protein [Acidobacteriota bacterium]